jgi:VWFA-related protein
MAAACAMVCAVALAVVSPAAAQDTPALRITSPLGRTGVISTVRIVAQLEAAKPAAKVDFYVDGTLVGSVSNGPPYAVNWVDENPFEPRKIVAEATDSSGHVLRDTISLPAFEVAYVADVKSIAVDAAVYDRAGRSVGSLDKSAFRVKEDGVEQALDQVSRESVPATILLMVDNSQSLSQRMDVIKRTTERFARTLHKGDRVIVAPFNARLGTITGPTDDAATITGAIEAMRAGGGTAYVDALADGVRLLDGIEGRRAIILITDGYDENSVRDPAEVITAAETAHVTIYCVGVGGVAGVSFAGDRTMRALAQRTGGRAFFPRRDQDVTLAASDVISDAHSRYLLFYTPENQRKDGLWRSITVEVPDGYSVRARDGYLAPVPPPIRPTIEFTARTSLNEYVNLSVDQIELREDGVVQSVDTFQEAVDPVSIVLTLDSSGSMKSATEAVKQTARDFVAAVRPEDSLALITFADEPLFAHLLGTHREWTLEAIDKYVAVGGTALYDALWNSLMHVKDAKGRRAVVLLTDGRDENNAGTAAGSTHTFAEVLPLLRSSGATVFTIGVGSRVDRDVLQRLATESGGDAYFPSESSELGGPFQAIVENLRRRYVLSYTSTNTKRDGGWRNVEITTARPDVRVTSGGGYRAPDQ